MSLFRPSVRLKLTLLYGVLFVTAGLLLIAVTYGLVRRELAPNALHRDRGSSGSTIGPSNPDERRGRRSPRGAPFRVTPALAAITGRFGDHDARRAGSGWLLAGEVLHPIQRITAHAKSSSATTLDERIHLDGPDDELKELADTFDAMLDRLQAAFRAQQGFAAQASHELRTPLAIIRAEAEVARAAPDATDRERQSADAILTAVGRSEGLVDGLLALTRSESTMLNAGPVDLADLTGDVVGEYIGEADQARVRLDLALDAAEVRGDPALLQRMVGNLVQNAIRYNVPDGTVAVSVRPEADMARLTVENSGPEVSQEEIDQLFQPFVRGDWTDATGVASVSGWPSSARWRSPTRDSPGHSRTERRPAGHRRYPAPVGAIRLITCGWCERCRSSDTATEATIAIIAATARMPGAISGSLPVSAALTSLVVVACGCSSFSKPVLLSMCAQTPISDAAAIRIITTRVPRIRRGLRARLRRATPRNPTPQSRNGRSWRLPS